MTGANFHFLFELAIGVVVFLVMARLDRKQAELYVLVNSRMSELLELTHRSSKAEGIRDERDRAIAERLDAGPKDLHP